MSADLNIRCSAQSKHHPSGISFLRCHCVLGPGEPPNPSGTPVTRNGVASRSPCRRPLPILISRKADLYITSRRIRTSSSARRGTNERGQQAQVRDHALTEEDSNETRAFRRRAVPRHDDGLGSVVSFIDRSSQGYG